MLGLQTRLVISEPGDQHEQEADRMADDVMRMPAPVVASNAQSVTPAAAFGSRAAQVDNGGRALPEGARSFFEPRFGQDFSRVRVHNDLNADSLSGQINAKAFTVGTHIHFGAGYFRPDTSDGKRLLAHELTHVIQQETGVRETGRLLQREPRTREERRDRRRHAGLLRFLKRVDGRKRELRKTKRRCDRAGEILRLIESRNEEFSAALENEGIEVNEDVKNRLRALCGPPTGKGAPAETAGEEEAQDGEAADEPKASDEVETEASIFTGCNPPRDLTWGEFDDVDPGTLGRARAQVNPILVPDEGANTISARLGPATRVERGAQTDSVLDHERIHWKITCKIVQLANREIAAGTNFRDVFRVATEVHLDLNRWQTGLYDRDTLDPDAIPRFDWPREWSSVVEDHWETAVRAIRTITIEPLN